MYKQGKKNQGKAASSLIVLLLLMMSCETQKEVSTGQAMEEETSVSSLPSADQIDAADIYQISKVSRASLIRCTGTIHAPPQSQATVSVPMGGFVKRIVPLEGQYIKKGATIAVLEHPDYLHLQEEYLEAQSSLAFLEKENTRQQLLAEANAGTGREKEKTESELRSAQVKVAALAKELRWLRIDPNKVSPQNLRTSIVIPAPVSGYVWNVSANPGKYLDRNAALVEMTDVDHLHLELQVYEQDAAKLREGQMINFRLGSDANRNQYEAKVYLIGQLVDPESRSLRVHGHLESEHESFKPGTFVEAEIASTADSVSFIPRAGIRGNDGARFVYIIEGQTLNPRSIEVSEIDQTGAYVGLAERLDGLTIWIGEEEETE